MHVGLFFQGLILLGSLGFLVVVFFAFKLSRETKNEKYWLILAISAIFLAVHQWAMVPWELHLITTEVKFVVQEVSVIIGAILFAFAVYGLYDSMKKIRRKME